MTSDKVKVLILDAQEKTGEDEAGIVLWGKTEKGEPVMVLDSSFSPYFYLEYSQKLNQNDVEELKKKISGVKIEGSKPKNVESVVKKHFGKEKKLIKITVKKPSDISKYRNILKDWMDITGEYEYDITYYKRYLIDRNITPLTWVDVTGKKTMDQKKTIVVNAQKIEQTGNLKYADLKLLAFDLELIEEGTEEKIIMASVKDNKGYQKVFTYKKADSDVVELVDDEKELVKRLSEVIRERDPDVIVTYNGDRFDFVHLAERAKKYDINLLMGRADKGLLFKRRGRIYSAWTEGRTHFDVFSFIENILSSTLSSDVLTLDMVSKEILGKGKKKLEWEEMIKAWEESKGLEKVIKYCLRDSELTLSLAKAFLPQIFELCRITGQGLFDVSRMTYSQLVEWLLIKKAYQTGELIPNRPKYDEIQIRRRATPYTGGYVYPPKLGIHHNIALFDFKGLYPSITITHNISPETLYCNCCNGNKKGKVHKVPGSDYYYCKEHIGFVANTVKELVKKRIEIKKKMDSINSENNIYHVIDNRQQALKILANASYGYYGYAGSRWYSRVCAQSITAWGRYYIQKVIKRSEKSGHEVIYGDTDSLFIKVKSLDDSKKFIEGINKSLPGVMELEFQGMYKAGLFTPAKTGLTAKKRYALIDSDGDVIIRGFERVRRDWSQIARETQEKVLLAVLRDNSPEQALTIARKTIEKIAKEKIDVKKMVIHTHLTRALKDYEQIGPHVIAARKALKRGRPVAEGSLIAYIITKGPGSISERAEPAEDTDNYDPEYYINNQVLPAAMRVLSGLGYTEDDITQEGKDQASLDVFVRKSLKNKISDRIKKIKGSGKTQ